MYIKQKAHKPYSTISSGCTRGAAPRTPPAGHSPKMDDDRVQCKKPDAGTKFKNGGSDSKLRCCNKWLH